MSTLNETQTFSLEILTPKGIEMTADCVFAKVPSVNGEMGILPAHSPAIVQLDMGELVIEHADQQFAYYFIVRGYLQVTKEKAVILTPFLESLAAIDLNRAKSAEKRAQSLLASDDQDVDRERAHLALRRAQQRIHLVEFYRK